MTYAALHMPWISSHIHMGLTSCATGRRIISCRNRGICQKASIAYIGCTALKLPPLCEANLHPILLTSSPHVVDHSTLHLTSASHLSTTSCAFEGHYNMFVFSVMGWSCCHSVPAFILCDLLCSRWHYVTISSLFSPIIKGHWWISSSARAILKSQNVTAYTLAG